MPNDPYHYHVVTSSFELLFVCYLDRDEANYYAMLYNSMMNGRMKFRVVRRSKNTICGFCQTAFATYRTYMAYAGKGMLASWL